MHVLTSGALAADKKLTLVDHLGGEMIVKREEEFLLRHQFITPCPGGIPIFWAYRRRPYKRIIVGYFG